MNNPTGRPRAVWLVAMLVAALCGRSAAAQAPAPSAGGDPGATVTAAPADLPTNGTVTLSGLAYPEPGVQIRLTVTPPAGGPEVLLTTPDKDGRYSFLYGHTQAQGLYKVSAQAGKGAPSTAQFTVKTYLIDIDEDVADNKALLEEPAKLIAAVKHEVDNTPDSPAKTEMEDKLDKLATAVRPLADQAPKLKAALAPFQDMIKQREDADLVLDRMFYHLAQLNQEAKDAKDRAEKEIADSQKALPACDKIDQATMALRAIPDMLSIAKKPWQFAAAFATNMAKSALPPSAGPGADAVGTLVAKLPAAAGKPTEALAEGELELGSETEVAEKIVDHIPESVRATPAYKFVVTETKKFVPTIVDGTKSPLDMLDKAMSLAADVAGFAGEQLFAQYCEKFEGPVTATMVAHFYSKTTAGNEPTEWWTYSTEIKGTLTLRYPKTAEGNSVALSGQIQGGATRFTYKSNVFTDDLYGKMARGGIVRTKDIAPLATDNGSGGFVNSLASPTSFFIPVTGQFSDGHITIEMQDARTDFNETYTRGYTFYVVIAPTTLMLPVLGHFTLPYVGAHFLLDHLFKGDYTVEQSGKTMLIRKVASQDYPANHNMATYTINLKACNPGCP